MSPNSWEVQQCIPSYDGGYLLTGQVSIKMIHQGHYSMAIFVVQQWMELQFQLLNSTGKNSTINCILSLRRQLALSYHRVNAQPVLAGKVLSLPCLHCMTNCTLLSPVPSILKFATSNGHSFPPSNLPSISFPLQWPNMTLYPARRYTLRIPQVILTPQANCQVLVPFWSVLHCSMCTLPVCNLPICTHWYKSALS
jgi:hypothetical protein